MRVAQVLDALVELPAGTYEVGEPGEERVVELHSTRLGRWPVTNAEYGRFLQATGRAVPAAVAAEALVDEPRAAPLLHGYRGSTPVDRAALIDLLLRVGRLADEHPKVRSLTLNPVLARPDGFSVLHAVVEYGDAGVRPDTGPRRLRSV